MSCIFIDDIRGPLTSGTSIVLGAADLWDEHCPGGRRAAGKAGQMPRRRRPVSDLYRPSARRGQLPLRLHPPAPLIF